MHEVINDLAKVFVDIKPTKINTINWALGKNTTSEFYFESGDSVSVQCTDYDAKHEYPDHLRLVIDKQEFSNWINTKAY